MATGTGVLSIMHETSFGRRHGDGMRVKRASWACVENFLPPGLVVLIAYARPRQPVTTTGGDVGTFGGLRVPPGLGVGCVPETSHPPRRRRKDDSWQTTDGGSGDGPALISEPHGWPAKQAASFT